MNVLQWVGIIGAVWVAAAVLLAVVWHRAKKAQPRIATRCHCGCELRGDL